MATQPHTLDDPLAPAPDDSSAAAPAASATSRRARIAELQRALHVAAQAGARERAARIQAALGKLHLAGEEHAAAKRRLVRALEEHEWLFGAQHPETVAVVAALAAARAGLGEHEGALDLHQRVLAARSTMLGEHDPKTARVREQVLPALLAAGRYGNATAAAAPLIAVERTLGAVWPTPSAPALDALPGVDADLLARAAEEGAALRGEGRCASRMLLADGWLRIGRADRACAVLSAAADAAQRPTDRVATLVALARTHLTSDAAADAVRTLETALAACEQLGDEHAALTALVRDALAGAYESAGHSRARAAAATALAAFGRALGGRETSSAGAHLLFAAAHAAGGLHGRAVEHLAAWFVDQAAAAGPNVRAAASAALADACALAGRDEEAATLAEAALAAQTGQMAVADATNDRRRAARDLDRARLRLAEIAQRLGRTEQARVLYALLIATAPDVAAMRPLRARLAACTPRGEANCQSTPRQLPIVTQAAGAAGVSALAAVVRRKGGSRRRPRRR